MRIEKEDTVNQDILDNAFAVEIHARINKIAFCIEYGLTHLVESMADEGVGGSKRKEGKQCPNVDRIPHVDYAKQEIQNLVNQQS
jgi:hypothetical protein